ncbi:MAG: DUF2812 domain-containing protein [Roseburia sp.]|nr:DUF2812 domain-containing protein [Roseburia sp.]
MRTKVKTVLRSFDYMHCDDFAMYLSEMAAKGWHFKEWGVGLKFEQGEPENAIYAVEVFTNASENDLRPEPHTQEFAEYCEAAGWKLIDARQKFCIFKKVDENAVELFTPEERVKNAFKGTISGSAALLLVLDGLNAFLQWVNMNTSFESRIFSSTHWFSFIVWNVMFLAQLGVFVYAFVRKWKLQKRIRNGQEVYIGSWQNSKLRIGTRDVYITLLFAILLVYLLVLGKTDLVLLNVGVIVVTLGFSALLAKFRPENSVNVGIQVVFAVVLMTVIVASSFNISSEKDAEEEWNKLSLKMTDYRDFTDEIEDVHIYQDGNILGSYENGFVFTKTESVYYNVYKSQHSWILDKIWEDELSARYNEDAEDCAKDWGANKAFRNGIGTYYVRYENAILVLNEETDISLTSEQIAIICEKLGIK